MSLPLLSAAQYPASPVPNPNPNPAGTVPNCHDLTHALILPIPSPVWCLDGCQEVLQLHLTQRDRGTHREPHLDHTGDGMGRIRAEPHLDQAQCTDGASEPPGPDLG